MRINDKKSVCIRFGNRHDVCCAPVTICSSGALQSVNTCRYLVIYFVSARLFKCTFESARAKFYKSVKELIFGKVGRVASESVIMQLISSKCLPVLLCATEACPFLARDQSSVSFAVTRVLMKILRTRSRSSIPRHLSPVIRSLPVTCPLVKAHTKLPLLHIRTSQTWDTDMRLVLAILCGPQSSGKVTGRERLTGGRWRGTLDRG